MLTNPLRRHAMALYSVPACADSHRVRLVMTEKELQADIIDVSLEHIPEDLLAINPTGSIPTLEDRDVVIYGGNVVMEYLDERFPYLPLMPVDPVERSRVRIILKSIEEEWYPLISSIEQKSERTAARARKSLREGLVSLIPQIEKNKFFLGDDYTLIDATIAPVLWRLEHLDIRLPKEATGVEEYAERLFARPAFDLSLSEDEEEMR